MCQDYERDILDLHYDISLERIIKAGCFEKEDPEKYKYIPGGGNLLAKEGKIETSKGDDYIAWKLAMAFAKKVHEMPVDNETFQHYVLENRENEFLKILTSENEGTTVVLVLDKDHDFTNNIEDWNKTHPYEKVCLIEVWPECFVKKTEISSSAK